LFIAMAYYDGETLKARLARGPLAVANALEIATQIARGLEKAHQAGIVHRDIKPANLMVTRDGLVKILDFGVAKLRDRTSLTRTGVTLGTIAYMAPEQVRGGGADARADLWSLGVVLHEMLTGRSPFAADRDLIVIHNILNETPTPAARLRPDIPPDVATAIDRLMAKDPNHRFQSAGDVLQALMPHAPAAAASSFNQIIVAAAIVALVAAAGTIAWFVKRGSDERRVNTLVAEATRLADADDDIEALGAWKRSSAGSERRATAATR
jgi:serine/threonine-protein kinase